MLLESIHVYTCCYTAGVVDSGVSEFYEFSEFSESREFREFTE
jgi:hypothetical protein